MFYPEEIIEEIRNQNDIVDVVSEYIQLKKKGASYFGLCPFHNEKSGSFSVSPTKQIFYCFGCGAGGNVITFVMQINNFDFVEAVKYLAQRSHIELPQAEYSQQARRKIKLKQDLLDIHKFTAKYFYINLHSSGGQAGLNYINGRKVSEKVQKQFGLGFSNYARNDLYQYLKSKGYDDDTLLKSGLVIKEKNKDGYFDRFGNRLMFPIFDVLGNVIAFGGRIIGKGEPKYLNSPETILFDKSRNLYALNIARRTKRGQILIVEGYMDAIALHQAGFDNAVASLGTAFNVEHTRILKKYTSEVILLFDSDEAGTKAALRAIPILAQSGLKVRILQVTDAKDPDEFIIKYGAEAFEKLLKSAIGYVDFNINVIKKKYNLDNAEQNNNFINEAIEYLIGIQNNGIVVDSWVKNIAQIAGVTEKSVMDLVIKKRAAIQTVTANKELKEAEIIKRKPLKLISRYSEISEEGVDMSGVLQSQERILGLMCDNELIYQKVKPYLQPENFYGECYQKLAGIIYDLYEKGQNIYPANVINYFEEQSEHKIVSAVFAGREEEITEVKLENEVQDYVKKILKSYIDIANRKTEDLFVLQKMLDYKCKLETLNIKLTDG